VFFQTDCVEIELQTELRCYFTISVTSSSLRYRKTLPKLRHKSFPIWAPSQSKFLATPVNRLIDKRIYKLTLNVVSSQIRTSAFCHAQGQRGFCVEGGGGGGGGGGRKYKI